MQLCYLVVTRQVLELEPHMKNQFGDNFRKRYKELCKERTWFKPRDLSRAGENAE